MQDHDADVAVIGLGAMGAAVLYQLARCGIDVLGIERFASPHARGSSHGQTRITRRATGEGADCAPFVEASHAIWRELEALTGETLLVDCGVLVVASGGTSTHGRDDFLAETLAIARERGIAHETLDAPALRARFSMFTGITDADIGYLEPGGGYVFPDRCIAAQLRAARDAGAAVLENTRVGAVRECAGGVEIDTPSGTLRAARAVIAAGAWCGPLLGAPFDDWLVVRRQVLHWFEVDPAASAAYATMPTFVRLHGPGDEDVFYGFPSMPGEHAIKVATEQYGTATTAESLAREVAPGEASDMHARHVAPCLAGVRPSTARESVACTYTLTPDHRFVIDTHPDMPRVTVVSACSGHGFKHSAGIGRAVAETLTNGHTYTDLAPFALDRDRLAAFARSAMTAP